MSAKDGPVSLGSIEEPDPLQSIFLPVFVFCAPAQPHCYFTVGKEADLLVVPVYSAPSVASAQMVPVQSVPSAAFAQMVPVIVVFLTAPE